MASTSTPNVEHHLQPGDVGALGLRQLVDVALEQPDAGRRSRTTSTRRARSGPWRSSARCGAAR
jgi:hypothetical protein